jgi:hypothetical protein
MACNRSPVEFNDIIAKIKLYQQKELMRLVVHRAILSRDYMKWSYTDYRPKQDHSQR